MLKYFLFNNKNESIVGVVMMLLFVFVLPLESKNKTNLTVLDGFIKQRQYYVELKERQLELLKASVKNTHNEERRLKLYNEIYENYNSFVYDSAMNYVNKGLQLALAINNKHYITLNQLHKALLLGTRGFYYEAISSISDINVEDLAPQ